MFGRKGRDGGIHSCLRSSCAWIVVRRFAHRTFLKLLFTTPPSTASCCCCCWKNEKKERERGEKEKRPPPGKGRKGRRWKWKTENMCYQTLQLKVNQSPRFSLACAAQYSSHYRAAKWSVVCTICFSALCFLLAVFFLLLLSAVKKAQATAWRTDRHSLLR